MALTGTGSRVGLDDASGMETARQIVETAERLYRQYGYQKTTVAEIAQDLGMSPANVYRFFASKSAITQAVAMKITGELEDEARSAAAAPGLSAPERLARLLRGTHRLTVQRCMEDRRMHAMVHAAMTENWTVIERHKEKMHGIVTALLTEGALEGAFAIPDPAAAAQFFLMSTVALYHPQLIEQCLQKGEDLDALLETILPFVLKALGAEPARR